MTDDLFDIFMEDEQLKENVASRFVTGWTSFDRAVSDPPERYGLALRGIFHVNGHSRAGKTTFVWSLCSKICAKLEKDMILANLEPIDYQFFVNVARANGFGPPLNAKEIDYDYDGVNSGSVLKQLANAVTSKNNFCGILDSVGTMMAPKEGESNSPFGEAFMGKVAHVMNQFTKRLSSYYRENDGIVCAINHLRPNIGFMGYHTPGGTGLRYSSSYEIRLQRLHEYGSSYSVAGKILKSKHGIDLEEFKLFMLYGKGVHSGLTAILDCADDELFIAPKNKPGDIKATSKIKVKETGEELYSFRKYVELAHEGATEEFQIFHDLLGDNDA